MGKGYVRQVLGPEDQESVHILLVECIRSVARTLEARRKNVKVRGIKESSYFQLIAVLGVAYRTLELYPDEVQVEIQAKALELADIIMRGSGEQVQTTIVEWFTKEGE